MTEQKARGNPPETTPEGYSKALGNRQVQMIAIGGAIGTGLFFGTGERLQAAGPSLALVYLVCGAFSFLILRALGELVMHRPSAGSFVTYAREFLGEGPAFVAGWMYVLNWCMTGIADITAVALYLHYWPALSVVPQWAAALGAMLVVGSMNLAGVRWFGELEFWFALLKVGAILLFLVVGTVILGGGFALGGHTPGFPVLEQGGGLFPHGVVAALVLVQGVVFAFSGVELVGTAAGETRQPEKVLPRAINSVVWRVAVFYVGSVLLLALLMPAASYKGGQSPFVTVLDALGWPGAGTAMNVVVLTAALSSLNSGLYSTGRILRSLAEGGSAPPWLAAMNARAVPSHGIVMTLCVYAVGVGLNYLIPSRVFEIGLNIAALGVLSSWSFIVVCQMAFRRAVRRGALPRPTFVMPGAPVTAWITLAFLFSVLVLMGFDYPNGTFTVAALPGVAVLLWIGWRWTRRSGRRAQAA